MTRDGVRQLQSARICNIDHDRGLDGNNRRSIRHHWQLVKLDRPGACFEQPGTSASVPHCCLGTAYTRGEDARGREHIMNGKIVRAVVATLTLVGGAAPATAQVFAGSGGHGCCGWHGRWGYTSSTSGPFTCPTPTRRSARVAWDRRSSGFYLVGGRYDTDDYSYAYHRGGNASIRPSWADNGWRGRSPMR